MTIVMTSHSRINLHTIRTTQYIRLGLTELSVIELSSRPLVAFCGEDEAAKGLFALVEGFKTCRDKS